MSIKDGDLDYIIADGRSTEQLELSVQALMDEGFKPHGSMVIVQWRYLDGDIEPVFCQPMVLSK